MSCWRIFLTVLILLALPLKGVAAVAMPFCGAAQTQASHGMDHGANPSENADHGSGGHCASDDGVTVSASSSPASADCQHCVMCHLACASGLPAHAVGFRLPFTPVFSAAVPGEFVSFIPEVLFRPPLRPSMTALG